MGIDGRRIASVALLSVVLFISVVAEGAQIAGARIPLRGHLVVPGVVRYDQIEVRLVNQSGAVVARAYTDSQGDFELNAGLGTFFVDCTLAGYEPIHERLDILNNTGGQAAVTTLAFTRLETVGRKTIDYEAIDRSKWPKKLLESYDQAMEEKKKGNTASARTRLESVVKQAPQFYNAHLALGSIYQEDKRTAEADREYTQARILNPKSTQPLVSLGSLYIQSADARAGEGPAITGPLTTGAAAFLQEAVRLNDQSPAAFALLGTLAYRMGNLQAAEEDLSRALRLDSHLSSARLTLANVYTRSEKWKEAVASLDAYLADNPKAANRDQIEQARNRAAQNLR